MATTQITENFTLEEFERSDLAEEYGVSNTVPTTVVRLSITALCECVLQPLRDEIGEPVIISSGYRSKALNEAVGGVESSQHRKGEAADIKVAGMEPVEVARVVYGASAIWAQVDQMILYPTFLHLSHKRTGSQRQQLLYDKTYKGDKVVV